MKIKIVFKIGKARLSQWANRLQKTKNLKEGQKASWIFFSGQESLVFQSLDKYNIYGFNIRKFRKGDTII